MKLIFAGLLSVFAIQSHAFEVIDHTTSFQKMAEIFDALPEMPIAQMANLARGGYCMYEFEDKVKYKADFLGSAPVKFSDGSESLSFSGGQGSDSSWNWKAVTANDLAARKKMYDSIVETTSHVHPSLLYQHRQLLQSFLMTEKYSNDTLEAFAIAMNKKFSRNFYFGRPEKHPTAAVNYHFEPQWNRGGLERLGVFGYHVRQREDGSFIARINGGFFEKDRLKNVKLIDAYRRVFEVPTSAICYWSKPLQR